VGRPNRRHIDGTALDGSGFPWQVSDSFGVCVVCFTFGIPVRLGDTLDWGVHTVPWDTARAAWQRCCTCNTGPGALRCGRRGEACRELRPGCRGAMGLRSVWPRAPLLRRVPTLAARCSLLLRYLAGGRCTLNMPRLCVGMVRELRAVPGSLSDDPIAKVAAHMQNLASRCRGGLPSCRRSALRRRWAPAVDAPYSAAARVDSCSQAVPGDGRAAQDPPHKPQDRPKTAHRGPEGQEHPQRPVNFISDHQSKM